VLPDIDSPYYWVRNVVNMVVWLLCLAAALLLILWIAQHIGGNVLPLGGRYAASAEAAHNAATAGDHRMAIEHFSKALAIDDSKADLWLGRASSRLGVKDAQGAMEDAAAAVVRGLPEAQVLLIRARAYQLLGKPGAAIAQLDRIIAADPNAREARRIRAGLHADGGSLDKALADIDFILATNPDDPEAMLLRAELALRRGNWQSASSDFLKMTQNSTEDPKAWIGAGVALLDLGNDANALAAFEQALRLRQSGRSIRAAALLGQALALHRLGHIDRAINSWATYVAVSRSPIAPSIQSVKVDDDFLRHVYFKIASRPDEESDFIPTSKDAAPPPQPRP
jgi:tetratricopeptide (TPR) repeat protein